MYIVRVGISYDHPDKGFVQHLPGPEPVDLSDWPDLDKLLAEGTIVEAETVVTDEPAPNEGAHAETADLKPPDVEYNRRRRLRDERSL